jgi:hypothetical protein
MLAGLMVLALVTSCSSISVSTDYDRGADFDGYKTYAFFPQDENVAMSLVDKRIRNSVNTHMQEKGFQLDESDPDLLVAYQTGVKERATVSGTSYGTWWGPGYRDVQVYQYEEGNLVLDLVDSVQKQLVWRGTASAVVGDPSGQEAKIDEAVRKMLSKFPPKS